jgi:hypothetical protein
VFWNVDGLYSTADKRRYNKLNMPHAQAALSTACLVGVAELKLKAGERISPVEGFTLLHQAEHPTSRSGGLAVFAKAAVASRFQVVASSGADGYVVVRCPGGVQVVFVYFAPAGSVVYSRASTADPMDVLQHLLDTLRPQGPVVFLGDFNARCGTVDDRADPAVDVLVECLGVDAGLQRAHRAGLPPRHSDDQVCNARGQELITLMQVEDVVLLNGRAHGRNSCYTYKKKGTPPSQGSSAPDLCLLSADAYRRWGPTATLNVGPTDLHADFDHLPLCLTLPPASTATPMPSSVERRRAPHAVDEEDEVAAGLPEDWYERVMGGCPAVKPVYSASRSQQYATHLQALLPTMDATLSSQDPAAVLGCIKKCMEEAAHLTMPWVTACPKADGGRLSALDRAAQAGWYTADLVQLRRRLDSARLLQGASSEDYLQLARVYKSRCRAAKKAAHVQHVAGMRDMLQHAPGKFWKQYKRRRGGHAQYSTPAADTWEAYGSQLYGEQRPVDAWVPVGLHLPVQGVDREVAASILDAPCTEEEMHATLRLLQAGKAEDVYGLRAEHLTLLHTHKRDPDGQVVVEYQLSKYLAHAFNVCMATGAVPDMLSWGKGCPLHKAGDFAVHDNYRVIVIEPVMAKVFSLLMHNRAERYLEQQRLRVPEQCGFRRQRSCVDQLFVLDHIIRRYQQQGQKVLALFVDFRKAFDSVPRVLLFQRLQQLGFSPRYLQMLQSVYASARVSFSARGAMSAAVQTHAGVLQGDPLSPTLFGVYVDCVITHMQRLFRQVAAAQQHVSPREQTPLAVPQVGGVDVHGLLYADDLVLLSLDDRTAQLQLRGLAAWCNGYGMQVNMHKSAAVVFRPRGPRTKLKLMYRGQAWPQKESYQYLGLTFSSTAGIMACLKGLERAGHRAAMATIARCRQLHIDDIGTAMQLFNSQVLPCLLYGAEVWLPYLVGKRRLLSDPVGALQDSLERVQLRFVKRLLHLRQTTASWVVLAEAGRLPMYMYGLRRVCRYWNKLAACDQGHLARRALLDSLEGGTLLWAGQVVGGIQAQLGLSWCRPDWTRTEAPDPHGQDAGAGPDVPQMADTTGMTPLATIRVFALTELQLACEQLLDTWWQRWGATTQPAAGSHVRQYALWFKAWPHVEAKQHYLYDSNMPKQLQYGMLQLRTFNLKLAVHVAKWRAKGVEAAHAPEPACQWCTAGENEQHVLYECPAYADLRHKYSIPVLPDVAMFTDGSAACVPRYIRAVMRRREQGTLPAGVPGVPALAVAAAWPPGGGTRRTAVTVIRTDVALLTLLAILFVATLLWALDAYRV